MKQNINIEAEGSELVLKNKVGDYVIIPKKYRVEVQDMIKEGCHGCIDALVETLPIMEDYASDGSIIPNDNKNNFKDKSYTAIQDNTYVASRVVKEQKKKQQFVQRELPVLKADTRTAKERKIAQEYRESVLNPSISTQIGETLQKPLRWIADPVKGIGDIVSAIAPNSALAKDLPNTHADTFEYRKKRLNPYISNKEKINNAINEAIPLTNWALLNTLPAEAAVSHMIKSGKNLIKPVSKVVDKTDDVIKNLPKFKSKIDWGKWNKEIPNNKSLMDEYLQIEKTTKQNGTWMKNPDGTDFPGTPEQFVQQNSSNFKKAFPEGYNKVYRGGDNENLANRPHPIVFTGDKATAQHYTGGSEFANNIATPEQYGGRALFELYHPKSNNSITINNQGRS